MSEDGGPQQLFRPIPRRPFELGLMTPSPPDDDSAPSSPTSNNANSSQPGSSSLLDPPAFAGPAEDSISRAASYNNLTSSTLAGIYSHNVSGYPASDNVYGSEPPDTPWGTGAETPATAARGSVDESIYRLVKGRSSLLKRRRSSALSARSGNSLQQQQGSPTQTALSLALRTAFLFVLGLGYGAILSRLSTEQQWASFPVEGIIRHRYDSAYLACWGVFGVAVGSLLPWFDGKWEQAFEKAKDEDEEDFEEEEPATDWALVVRGVGAFVGIVFAIRKVPWASTMQVSMTLFMANPFLWYLIDRSKSGFLLSAAVAWAGSVILVGLNPDIVPAPSGFSSEFLNRNHTGNAGGELLMLGGLATQKTIETVIWVLSVLFCSCVCFGNIGRRLALNRSAAGRGRWGGLK
ncbi:insulin-induced protein [Diaporthe helianthi]|uniref:Insulin-induced protein n=1 Tax=Diaporthe helianthi TaxID=158607 RepID=A0A2P5HFG3_DIAHE|nr:insulin-induced protein [Diaporthe helianthi]